MGTPYEDPLAQPDPFLQQPRTPPGHAGMQQSPRQGTPSPRWAQGSASQSSPVGIQSAAPQPLSGASTTGSSRTEQTPGEVIRKKKVTRRIGYDRGDADELAAKGYTTVPLTSLLPFKGGAPSGQHCILACSCRWSSLQHPQHGMQSTPESPVVVLRTVCRMSVFGCLRVDHGWDQGKS